MEDAVISVHDLRISFFGDEGEVPAVDGVSFSLQRGRVLALVGESGSGKSVTSLGILRLTQPPGRLMGGKILFRPKGGAETDLAAMTPNDPRLFSIRGGRIGMIFQEPMTALSPVHTVGDQVGEVLRLHKGWKRAKCDEVCAEMLARVGIADPVARLRQFPFEMSGGMRQRIVIAMAMICNPDVVIADEPTTALDVTIQAQILDLLRSLQQERGMALVLITHNMGVVSEMARRIAVMYAGQVMEQRGVAELFADPQHPYTEALLAALPERGPAGHRLATIPGVVPGVFDRPAGCLFAPRCPYATQHAMSVRPQLREWRGGLVRCHYPLGDAQRLERIEQDGPIKVEAVD